MRFSLNFIKEFVEIDLEPERLAQLLTLKGLEVERFQRCADDWVFEVEVTSNRYDWLSILGVAYEIGACLHKKVKIKYPRVIKKPFLREREIIIEDKKDCPFYVGRAIRNVKIGESPRKIQRYLLNCGINPVNNVVDITNYCMLKWGNPLHAFDMDKLEGDISVRRAKPGEVFLGLDNKERILNPENLVIADQKKVVALAGVMGAKNSQVDSQTKNIFLEAAIFSGLTIRRSCKRAGVATESSYRFERRVFADYLEYASMEATNLIQRIAQGSFFGYRQCGQKPLTKRKIITLNLERLNTYLGTNFSAAEVKTILKRIGCTIVKSQAKTLRLRPACFRLDIESQVDLYEEFMRIYGYEKLNPTLPFLLNPHSPRDTFCEFKTQLRSFLMSLGWKEIITYSIVAEEDLYFLKEKDFIRLTNPLRKEQNALRPSLLLGMLEVVRYNLNRQQEDLRFFEIANIYLKSEKAFVEKPVLALGISAKELNFFYLKGAVERLLQYFSIEGYSLKEESLNNFTNALSILKDNKELGFLGKLDRSVKEKFSLEEELLFAQLDLELLKNLSGQRRFQPFSVYPLLWQDISLAIPKGIKFTQVEETIRREGKNIVGLQVIDTYQGKGVPSDYFAFTLRVFYQSSERTLTLEEVNSSQEAIRKALLNREGIILR